MGLKYASQTQQEYPQGVTDLGDVIYSTGNHKGNTPLKGPAHNTHLILRKHRTRSGNRFQANAFSLTVRMRSESLRSSQPTFGCELAQT